MKEWKFFTTRSPVIGRCSTSLTRKALSCLYFRKTKSEVHFVSDLFDYTGSTADKCVSDKCVSVMFPPFRTSCNRPLFNIREPLQKTEMSESSFICVILESLHE